MDARGPHPPFRDLLRQHRIAAGLSQERLAERAGLSVRAVSDLERGMRRAPRLETVRMLAEGLGLDLDERAGLLRAARDGERSGHDEVSTLVPIARSRLPVPPTPLVGREAEIAKLLQLLGPDWPRLVTLTGPGGVGKTRLAIEAARRAGGMFAGEALFVDLGTVGEAGLVARAIADVLDPVPATGPDPAADIALAIGEKHLLLILDNFEHVLAAATVVAGLLARCPALRVLATSRIPLDIRGERQFPVPALRSPGAGHARLDDVLGADAVRLFLDRARDAWPDFAIDEESAGDVAAICRRLDGIPLALELAAVRVKILPPSELLLRLERSLPLLTGGPVDVPARHQTLRATIEWSHELLERDERIVFRRLAIFAGGVSLEAADAVVDPEGEIDVLDALASLVNKNMVSPTQGTTTWSRYTMLETLREFALEQLQASGELEMIGDRHARYFLSLAQASSANLADAEHGSWLSRLEADQANMRAALAWFRDHDVDASGMLLAIALGPFWRLRSAAGEGRGWLETFLGKASSRGIADAERLAALQWVGELAGLQGDHDAARAGLHESLSLAMATGNEPAAAAALGALGSLMVQLGHVPASIPLFEEGAAIARSLGNDRQAAFILSYLAIAVAHQGNLPRASSILVEAQDLLRSLGDLRSFEADFTLMSEGWISYLKGDLEGARRALASGLALGEAIDAKAIVSTILAGMGEVAMTTGNQDNARIHYLEGLRAGWDVGFPPGIVFNAQGLARIASGVRGFVVAARFAGVVDRYGDAIRTLPGPGLAGYHASVANAHDALGDGTFAAEHARGRDMRLNDLLDLARAIGDPAT